MRGIFLAATATIALVGCTGAVETVSANTDGVTIRHAAGYEASANSEAQQACGNYGKKARSRSSHDDGGRRFVIYDCVPM